MKAQSSDFYQSLATVVSHKLKLPVPSHFVRLRGVLSCYKLFWNQQEPQRLVFREKKRRETLQKPLSRLPKVG